MNGTLRTELNYGAALAELIPTRLRLCRYHSTRRRFLPVGTLPKTGTVCARPDNATGAPKSGPLGVGRRIERAVRGWRRSATTTIFQLAGGLPAGSGPFPGSSPGDILLLAGETWSRHDFSALRRVREYDKMRIVAICQDLIPIKCPQFFEADGFIERFRRYIDFLIDDVDLVLAVSAQTKTDISDYARGRGGPGGEIKTIELGHDVHGAARTGGSQAMRNLEPGKFVLSVSTIQSRKNFSLLYHLWRRFSEENLPNLPKLVIVGRQGFGSHDLLSQIKHDPVVRDCVIVSHDASDETLSQLYRDCAWTVYPSFYEGWGLPISESLAYGKFCVASNAAALVEAGQGLVKHIDPLDFAAWHSAIGELVRSPDLVAERERAIKTHYRAVTWKQSAAHLAALLQAL